MDKKSGRFLDWILGVPYGETDLGFCPKCETVDVMISTHLCLPALSSPLPGGELTANDWSE